LDPYPTPGNSKIRYVARWVDSELVLTNEDELLFEEKINNLQGHSLTACVFEFPPLVIKREVGNNTFKYTGLEVAIFEEIGKLLNFTYNYYEPPAGELWGKDVSFSFGFPLELGI